MPLFTLIICLSARRLQRCLTKRQSVKKYQNNNENSGSKLDKDMGGGKSNLLKESKLSIIFRESQKCIKKYFTIV